MGHTTAGHVRKVSRKDGSRVWRARYPNPNPAPGQSHAEITKTFRLKDDALAWIAEQQVAMLHGTWADPRRLDRPFSEVIETWKETRWPRMAPKTRDRYQSVLDVHVSPTFGPLPVSRVTRERVSLFIAQLGNAERRTTKGKPAGKPLSSGSVHKVHTVLSSICTEAVELGLMRANPCARLRGLPPVRTAEMHCLTAEEVARLADAITPRYRVLIITAAHTGLRASELHALRRRDVDLLRGRIHVRDAIKGWVDGKPILGPPKNSKPRSVSLPPKLRQILADHLASSIPGGAGADAFVFTNGEGGPIYHTPFMRNHFRPAVKACLPPEKCTLRFHDLRHTSASLLIANGANPKQIQERLGHASINMTLGTYGHLLDGHDEALLAALDDLIDVGPTHKKVKDIRSVEPSQEFSGGRFERCQQAQQR